LARSIVFELEEKGASYKDGGDRMKKEANEAGVKPSDNYGRVPVIKDHRK